MINYLQTLIFLLPWFFGLFIFLLIPIAASLFLSFADYDGISSFTWLGFNNYIELFQDPLFFQSLKVTLSFAFVSLPLGTCLALALALLLNQKISGLSFYRSALYLPSIIPIVASSVVWIWVFKADASGILNQVLRLIFGNLPNYTDPLWLSDAKLALPALIIMSLWSIGNPMIIYLAGLQNIPDSLYESAELDGANSLAKFWHITLPSLTPTILFNVIIGIIQVFQYFVPAYVMTNGGPQNSTMFYSLYIYQTAFDDFRLGYASALAWILFLIVLLFSYLAWFFSSRISR